MPHKFNAARRHKFPKKRYRVTNWAEYTEILRRRGDLTIWVTDDTLKQWRAPRRTTPGGQPKYSNIAIETCLTLRTIYKLPLRQTQGLMRSIARLMGVDIPVPDFSTLSRRGLGLRLPAKPRVDRTEPIHLTMDSTGLKIFGEGEWLQVKHETKAKRKSWRKLHLGLDLTTGEIICSDLTLDHVGDSTALPGLLDQFDGPVSPSNVVMSFSKLIITGFGPKHRKFVSANVSSCMSAHPINWPTVLSGGGGYFPTVRLIFP